jgi:hypothetical protein
MTLPLAPVLETVGDLRSCTYLVLSIWLPTVVPEDMYIHTHIHSACFLPVFYFQRGFAVRGRK